MFDIPLALTMEQECELQKFKYEVKRTDCKQLEGVCIELLRQLYIKNNIMSYLMKKAFDCERPNMEDHLL